MFEREEEKQIKERGREGSRPNGLGWEKKKEKERQRGARKQPEEAELSVFPSVSRVYGPPKPKTKLRDPSSTSAKWINCTNLRSPGFFSFFFLYPVTLPHVPGTHVVNFVPPKNYTAWPANRLKPTFFLPDMAKNDTFQRPFSA